MNNATKLATRFIEKHPELSDKNQWTVWLVDFLLTYRMEFQEEERLLEAKAKAIEEGKLK